MGRDATLELDHHASPLEAAIESPWFRHTITALIIMNAAILGILTYRGVLASNAVISFEFIDRTITYIFAFELFLKLLVYRLLFFKSGWNWFDLIVVGIALVPGAAVFSVLRAMRVLRVLRLLHVVPVLKRITEALFKALPGMGAVLAVLALVTYVAAVMATNMFGHTDDPEVAQMFGDLPRAAFSLFQVMTLDGWRFEVVQKVIDDGNPYAWVFFLTYIFVASFAVFNLFIALIVDALSAEQRAIVESAQVEIIEEIEELEEEAQEAHSERDEILQLLTDLKAEVAKLSAAGRKTS